MGDLPKLNMNQSPIDHWNHKFKKYYNYDEGINVYVRYDDDKQDCRDYIQRKRSEIDDYYNKLKYNEDLLDDAASIVKNLEYKLGKHKFEYGDIRKTLNNVADIDSSFKLELERSLFGNELGEFEANVLKKEIMLTEKVITTGEEFVSETVEFVGDHIGLIMIAVAFIPVVGWVADAAEITILGVEGVEVVGEIAEVEAIDKKVLTLEEKFAKFDPEKSSRIQKELW